MLVHITSQQLNTIFTNAAERDKPSTFLMKSEQLFGNLIMCYNTLAEEWAEAVLRELTFTCNTV